MKFNKKAFTIIEVLIALLIISMILISGFQAYAMILAGKVKLVERTKLEKETYFFTERLFQTIKEGGTIDYEEYFNRMVVNKGISDEKEKTSSGHFKQSTGFGNFGRGGNIGKENNYGGGFYYCRSGNGISMTSTGGCFYNPKLISDINGNNIFETIPTKFYQRYGQYYYQFYDFNYNADADNGDMDKDGRIIGDDDDTELGSGPIVFSGGTNVTELYLISGNKKRRTLFRYTVKEDSNKIPSAKCDFSDGIGTGSGCLGNIEFLILNGEDLGNDHKKGPNNDKLENDGIIDTWFIDKRFNGNNDNNKEVAGSSDRSDSYRKPLFPNSINISKFEIYPYPNKNQKKAWGEAIEDKIKISPYVILNMELKPSRQIKRRIKGEIRPIKINTTVNLTEVFSK